MSSDEYPVTIAFAPARRLVGVAHRGSYVTINKAFTRLSEIFAAGQLFGSAGAMVGIFYDDPSVVAEDDLRSFAAYELTEDIPLPDVLEIREMPAGDAAVLAFSGSYSGLPAAYQYLYGTWLPASGRAPDSAPSYEVYLNSPLDTAPGDLRTEIFLPLTAT
ncbi:AraC family transcriptional regulator [Pseudooceanicola algae]|uniref:DNA gyrase inhibitor n=1 Tax=Pseudooceanicola algae TaxID=1537215 RepID=A0A418SIN2_9RHOB|nr:GyrI-like domain-containing protein [Pseudooceanicola algae]QPM91161.1 DNA gyrase inhibitor [Pseudooceanicola algae]